MAFEIIVLNAALDDACGTAPQGAALRNCDAKLCLTANLQLFYEVKVNLRYDQLAMLRAGGVRAIQPGIESLSNQVLRLMKKGCTSL